MKTRKEANLTGMDERLNQNQLKPQPTQRDDSEHTPTPWTEEEIAGMLRHEVTDADFNFIIRAVNNFDALIDALQVALDTLEQGPQSVATSNTIPFIKHTIAKAEAR